MPDEGRSRPELGSQRLVEGLALYSRYDHPIWIAGHGAVCHGAVATEDNRDGRCSPLLG